MIKNATYIQGKSFKVNIKEGNSFQTLRRRDIPNKMDGFVQIVVLNDDNSTQCLEFENPELFLLFETQYSFKLVVA